MDKYERATLAIILTIVILTISYIILIISEVLGPFDSSFPFYILIPSWLPAIWIPIIAQKRQEQLKQQDELQEQMGD
jgi:hypothetical protein